MRYHEVMRKIFIILAIILITLSGCKKEESIGEEIKGKEVNAEVILKAIKPRYDYLCSFPQEITSDTYSYFAPYVMKAFNDEYKLRNKTEFKGNEDEFVKLCVTYFGISEEDVNTYLKYQKLDSSLVSDKYNNNISLIYYTVEDGVYEALIGYETGGELLDRMLLRFVFDGDNINILDKKMSNNNAILHFEKGDEAVYLFNNKQIFKTRNGLLSKKIDLNEFDLPSAIFMIHRWETTGEISEDFNTLTITSERAMSKVKVDLKNETIDISYLEEMPEDLEALSTNANNDKIIRVISDYGGEGQLYDLWLIKNNGEKVFLSSSSGLAQAGFFKNGDIYVWSYEQFHIYEDDKCIYKFEDHFDLSDKLLFAIQKGEDCFYAVYALKNGEYLDNDPTKLNTTYQFVRVDYDGNVLNSLDTGINTMINKHYYYSLNIRRDVDNNTMEIIIEDKAYCKIDLDSFDIIEIKMEKRNF